jgi:tRNA threonylcarbamoyladenosine biosynthesis protein TsaE
VLKTYDNDIKSLNLNIFIKKLISSLTPRSYSKGILSRLFTLSFCVLLPFSVQAHPHSWIDLKTEIEGNQNQITGFKMSWTFDAMTSAYMLDGEDLSSENKAKTMQKVANSVMQNMMGEHYFTYFYDGDTPIKYSLARRGVLTQHRSKLTLDFELPLSKPKILDGNPLKLLIFEPSYYVDMSWQKKGDIQLSPDLAKNCSLELIEPNPTSEQMSYAMSLPADVDPDNALGQLFTQTVLITCSVNKG